MSTIKANAIENVAGTTRVGVDQIGVGGFKNKIINGGFDIWQRGENTQFTDEIFADRWYCTTVQDWVAHRPYTAQKNLDYGHSNHVMALITNIDSTVGRVTLAQTIEANNMHGLYNKEVTLKFNMGWAGIADASSFIRVRVTEPTSTDDYTVATAREVQIYSTLDGTYKEYETSFVVSNGESVKGMRLEIDLKTSDTQNTPLNIDSLRFGNVQLEQGTEATQFEQRPYGMELALCQRYYEVGNIYGVSYGSSSVWYQRTTVTYTTEKLRTPSVTITKTAGAATGGGVTLNTKHQLIVGYGSTGASQEWYGTYTADAEL